jgi:hypothetical protein
VQRLFQHHHQQQQQQQGQGGGKRPLDLQPAVQQLASKTVAGASATSSGKHRQQQAHEELQLQRSTGGVSSGQTLVKDARDAAAAHAMPAVRDAAAAAAEQGCQALASLAIWQRLHVTDMAQRLMGMTAEQRRQLLGQYAQGMVG